MLQELETITTRPDWNLNPEGCRQELQTLAAQYADRAAANKTTNQAIKKDLETILQKCFEYWAAAKAAKPQTQQGKDAESKLAALLETGAARGKAELCAGLFNCICLALAERGFSVYTAHERAALKTKYGVSFRALERIGRDTPPPSIPKGERLTDKQARALFEQLTEKGYISGPLEAFIYHFGPIPRPDAERPANGLIWAKRPALFAFFVQTLSNQVKRPYGTNNAAFIAAFPGQSIETLESNLKRIRAKGRANQPSGIGGAEALAAIFEQVFTTK